MPTYEAQRALPPNEGTIKESWLAHQRREWQRNVSARRRSLSDDPSRPPPDLLDAEATAAAPAAATRRNKDRFERQLFGLDALHRSVQDWNVSGRIIKLVRVR